MVIPPLFLSIRPVFASPSGDGLCHSATLRTREPCPREDARATRPAVVRPAFLRREHRPHPRTSLRPGTSARCWSRDHTTSNSPPGSMPAKRGIRLLPRIRSNSLYSECVQSHTASRSSAAPLSRQRVHDHCSRPRLAGMGLYDSNSMFVPGSFIQSAEAVLYETDSACRVLKPWVRYAPSAGLVFASIYGGGRNSCIQVVCNGTSSCTAKACKI